MEFEKEQGEFQSDKNYAKNLSTSLNEFRKKKLMCDVILVVPPKEYLAHRNILCASSPYLLECLSMDASCTTLGSRIELKTISPSIMEDVLNFMYIGEVCVGKDNVEKLIAASDVLKMKNLKEITCRYYEKRLSPGNCLSIAALADQFNCDTLRAAADQFILQRILDVSEHREFKLLSCSHVQRLLSANEINVDREEQVYAIGMRWIHHDFPNRKCYLPLILNCVRLLYTSKYFIADVLDKEEELMSDKKCVEIINEAKYILNFPDRKHMLKHTITYVPRAFSDSINVLIACGGNQERMSSSEVLCYVPSQDFWYPLAPLKYSKFSSSSVVVNNDFICTGGKTEGVSSRHVEQYSFPLDKWVEHPPLPCDLSDHVTCVFNGEIHIIGGSEHEVSLPQVLKYSVQSGKWINLKNMKVPRKAAAVAVHKNLYVIGGYDNQGVALASVERYNPYLNEWSKIFPMNSTRAHASATCVADNIYVFGGEYAMWSYYRSCEMFNIKSDEWRNISDMSTPRALMGIALLCDKIYLVGGMVSPVAMDQSGFGDDDEDFVDVNETNLVECFDISIGAWSKVCSLPVPTADPNCGIIAVSQSNLELRFGI